MSNVYLKLTVDEFAFFLERFSFNRRITAVHLHHTRRPRRAQFRGQETMLDIARQHMEGFGFAAIAQHVTIAPDGFIWLGRHWNAPPASAAGHNGNADSGPFMVSLLGDFDRGADRLDGEQKETLLQVIALIQDRFALTPESLRFHRELSRNVTSPGETLDLTEMIKEIRKARSEVRKERKQTDGMRPFSNDALDFNRKLDEFSRQVLTRADSPNAEVKEELMESRDYYVHRGSTPFITGASSRAWFDGFNDGLNDEQIDEIRPHVINLRQGRFSTGGLLRSDPIDVDVIFEEHLPRMLQDMQRAKETLPIVFYAHGGLVSEKNALQQAYHDIFWWKQNKVYPLYFIWETGFLETIGQLLQRVAGPVGREATREGLFDPVVEKLVRALRGDILWSGMKQSAQAASEEGGAAHYVARKLQEFCETHKKELHLHAIGHSAGSIFHSHFLPVAHQMGVPSFKSVHFLAPALTVAGFKARLMPLLKQAGVEKPAIDQLTLFTLRKELELNDKSAMVYGKSILYLVHQSLEANPGEAILGLEVSLRGDGELKRTFGLGGQKATNAEVIWATTRGMMTGLSASQATTHSSFNDDRPTMNSVLRRILEKDDNDPIIDFPTQQNRSLSAWDNQLPLELARWGNVVGGSATAGTSGIIVNPPARTSVTPFGTLAATGHKRALCVGIDRYPVRPLQGGVFDANAWAQALMALGFEPPLLLLDAQATRDAILGALTSLVSASQAGDVVVFQYSGHGTELRDQDGDEADEDTPQTDEAICPIDFMSGAFIVDDDLRAIFARIPEGVNVTCFIDCCHSGTISRLAIGAASSRRRGMGDERERFLVADEAMIDAHHQFRRSLSQERGTLGRGPQTMRQIVFSACRSDEVAWETDGKGEFTLHATKLLREGTFSNESFQEQIVAAFGVTPRQHPVLDCASTFHRHALLQPLTAHGTNRGMTTRSLPFVPGNDAEKPVQWLRMAYDALTQGT